MRLKWVLATVLLALVSKNVSGATLRVMSLVANGNLASPTFVTAAPYLTWSSAKIQANPNGWIPTDQLLIIQTDQLYHSATAWAVQVYTDNTDVKASTFTTPGYLSGSTYIEGSIINAPISPRYTGNRMAVSGLVSADGRSLLPLIWSFYNCIPDSRFANACDPANTSPNELPPPIVEVNKTKPTDCDFTSCNWFYFKDRADVAVSTATGLVIPDFFVWSSTNTPSSWYTVPLSNDGGKYVVCPPNSTVPYYPAPSGCPWQPASPDPSTGLTSQYFYVAMNPRNGTRQLYQTTLFIELLIQ